jgi:hypothetical protein
MPRLWQQDRGDSQRAAGQCLRPSPASADPAAALAQTRLATNRATSHV